LRKLKSKIYYSKKPKDDKILDSERIVHSEYCVKVTNRDIRISTENND